jgi:tRNA U34 2-thiouridine synthase MnmA/TrmU
MAGRLLCRGEKYIVAFAEKQKAVPPGQSAAFYQGDVLLGSGIIK